MKKVSIIPYKIKIILYICRIKADGTFGLSYPCKHCIEEIEKFNVKTIYYTTENGCWQKIKVKNLQKKHISLGWRSYERTIKSCC